MFKLNFTAFFILFILLIGYSRAQDHTIQSGHTGNVNSLAFSPDSKQMVSCDENGLLIFWDTDGFKNSYSLNTGTNITSVSFSPDGSTLAYTQYNGNINFMNSASKEITRNFSVEGNAYSAVYSKDGKYLSVTYTTLKEEKDKDGAVSEQLVDYTAIYNTSDFSLFKRLKTGSTAQSIGSIFGTNIFKTYLSNSFNSDFSVDGNYLATGGNTKSIPVYSLQMQKYAPPYKGHSDKIYYVTFSMDGEYLASCSKDESVKVWNIKTGNSIKTLSGHSGDVNSASFSRDSKYLATGGDDESVKIWDTKTTKQVKSLDGFNFDILSVKFSPDGQYLAASGKFENIMVWKTSNVLPK